MGILTHPYLSAPAETDGCPFGDCSFRLLLNLSENRRDLLLGLCGIPRASKVSANGLFFFFRVGWEPGRVSMPSLKQVWNKDLISLGAVGTMGKDISALFPIGW